MNQSFAYQRLLAKSSRYSPPPHAATLLGHLQAATSVAQELVAGWGGAFLDTVRLSRDPWLTRLHAAVPRAAFAHDLGKGSSHFQRMIRNPAGPNARQALRHEYLGLWLLVATPDLATWLLDGCDEVTRIAVLTAVAGHHLKLPETGVLAAAEGPADLSLHVFAAHKDMVAALEWAADALRLPSPPRLRDTSLSLVDRHPLSEAEEWVESIADWWVDQDLDTRVFISLVKALVIGADVAGSALPRTAAAAAPRAWVSQALAKVTKRKNLQAVVQERLGALELRPFQQKMCASHARVTFVRAGCGSGKTAGAYAWAQRHVGRKLFFCYPTTGTATEGFADYAPHEDSAEWALVHSRAAVDLEEILGNARDDGALHVMRVKSLESWDAPVTICTVDAVLGLLQNHRRGLFSSPAILNGAFVFDEIHQYDDALFHTLEHFLRTFRGAPVLLMTASLQRQRLERLRALLAAQGEALAEIDGPSALEAIPRYRIEVATLDQARGAVSETLAVRGKVLWVANQVDRCRALARDAARWAPGATVLAYHSRYRYQDRLARHRAVIDAFTSKDGTPVLAVTTQVCEVSLDLSADLLVTDLAPVPALIQRLGRLNRRVSEDAPGQPCRALVLEPETPLPYEASDLQTARHWLEDLGSQGLSQAMLAGAFERLSSAPPDGQQYEAAWLTGGPYARKGELREPGMTGPVVRAEDLFSGADADAILRSTIPMPLDPVTREMTGWDRAGMVSVAPRGRVDYSSEWGAAWAKTA